MKTLYETDYLIVKENWEPLRFTDGQILIYWEKTEAEEDRKWNERVIHSNEISAQYETELLNQIELMDEVNNKQLKEVEDKMIIANENKNLILNLSTGVLQLVEDTEPYKIWTVNVIINNDLDNLIYIWDIDIYNKAKELIKITYTFKEIELYYRGI